MIIPKAILLMIFGVWFGYGIAHLEIATEREKLNAFYVGNRVFYCQKIEASGDKS